MQKKIYPIKESDSDFIKDLLADINKTTKLHQNKNDFIKFYNLIEIPFARINQETSSVSEVMEYGFELVAADMFGLPTQLYYGHAYLIKNNSIFEITNYASMESDGEFNSSIQIHNLDLDDVSEIKDAKKLFYDLDEIVSDRTERTNDFVTVLIRTGFKLYVKK